MMSSKNISKHEVSPLQQTNRKMGWTRLRVKGTSTQFRNIILELVEFGDKLHSELPAPSYHLPIHHQRCSDAIDAITKAEKIIQNHIDEIYALYKESNPPKYAPQKKRA